MNIDMKIVDGFFANTVAGNFILLIRDRFLTAVKA
jgi:hypothetical protein